MGCLSLSGDVDEAGFESQDLRRGPAALVRVCRNSGAVAESESWPASRPGRNSTTCSDNQEPLDKIEDMVDMPSCGSALHTALMTSRSPNVLRCAVSPSRSRASDTARARPHCRAGAARSTLLDPPPPRAPRCRARTRGALAPHRPQPLVGGAGVLRSSGGVRGQLRGAGTVVAVLLQMRLHLPPPRRELRSAAGAMPAMSAIPFRTGPHSTPSRLVSSSAAAPRTDCPTGDSHEYNGRPSNADHFPSAAWARLPMTTCVCRCGSPARDVRCRNAAATNPSASSTVWPP